MANGIQHQVSNHHSKSLFTYEMSDIPLAVTEQHLLSWSQVTSQTLVETTYRLHL